MADWEQYFEKIVCENNIFNNPRDRFPYCYRYENQNLYLVKSSVNYRYRNPNATELEDNLPMPPTDTFEYMFANCESLTNVDALKNWDSSCIEDISYIFYGCNSLTSYPKNLEELKAFATKTINNICMQFDKLKKSVCDYFDNFF